MIDLITRIQSTKLYDRMRESALENAYEGFNAHSEIDMEGLPRCAETYNRLAKQSKADILGFIEDDVEFLTPDWNLLVEDIFLEYDPEILGVVGATQYSGGGYFDAGNEFSVGAIAGNHEGKTHVRIFSEKNRYTPVRVVDGMLMFARREWFLRNLFDEKTFDELFFYDIDLCLRAGKVGVTSDILVKHSKPPELYGKYPPDMKPMSYYEPLLLERHNLTKTPARNPMCCMVSLDTFKKVGQTECYRRFVQKYLCASR